MQILYLFEEMSIVLQQITILTSNHIASRKQQKLDCRQNQLFFFDLRYVYPIEVNFITADAFI